MSEQMKHTSDGLPKNWDGKDWQTYKWTMKTVFMEHDLLDIVDGTIKYASLTTNQGQEDWRKKQIKSMRMIGTTVPAKILKQINDKQTGPDMWNALCEIYEGKRNQTMKAHTIRRLITELKNMKFKLGSDVNVHLSEMYCKRVELTDLQYSVLLKMLIW
jgi:hypothetical protein